MITWIAIIALGLVFLGCGWAFQWSDTLEAFFDDEEHPKRRAWFYLCQIILGFTALAAGYGVVSLLIRQAKAAL